MFLVFTPVVNLDLLIGIASARKHSIAWYGSCLNSDLKYLQLQFLFFSIRN